MSLKLKNLLAMISMTLGMSVSSAQILVAQDDTPPSNEAPQNYSEPEPAVDTSNNQPQHDGEAPAPPDDGGATEFSE